MFEQPSVQVHRISYNLRGPEWAFAIPQGDLPALEDVLRLCSTFWNGIGSLLVPVRSDGRVYPALDGLLAVRGVETVLLHDRLGEKARDSVVRRFPKSGSLYEGVERDEIHPLYLSLNNRPEELGTLWRPMLETKRLQRIALAVWGHISDEDLPDWRARFNLGDAHGLDGQRKLVSSQIRGNAPLHLGGRYMSAFEQRGGVDRWPQLFVFGEASFNEIVLFWNLRSRSAAWGDNRGIVALPRELMSSRDLQPVKDWVDLPTGATHYKPDVTLIATERDLPQARNALNDLGFKRVPRDARLQHSWPRPPEGREDLEYSEWPRWPDGTFKRGAVATALVTVSDRRASLEMPAPDGVKLPFGYLRLAVRGLPLPLPMNSITASRMIPNAYASQDGMTVLTTSGSPRWGWDIVLPDQGEALEDWASSHGYSVSPSQPGLYGQALIGRLSGPEDLDSLASSVAISVLGELAPKSTKKLAQRIAGRIEEESVGSRGDVDEEKLVGLLRDQGLLLTVEAKTLQQISSLTGLSQKALIDPLAALVEAGLVRRGVSFRCPRCNFHQLVPVNDLDERVDCQACRKDLIVPVSQGRREYPTSYFLDGLAARLMEQDLLSVILALRRALRNVPDGNQFFGWPGLLFRKGREIDADLLVSDGERVSIFECKARAEGLTISQTRGLVGLCEGLGARPGIAAIAGEFDPDVISAIEEAGGEIYGRDELFAHGG